MILLKKIFSYYKDLVFQWILIYIFFISPIGSLSWMLVERNCNSCGYVNSIFSEVYNSSNSFLETIFSLLIYMPLYVLVVMFPLLISYTYIVRINTIKVGTDEYLGAKIVLFIIFSGVYFFIISLLYHFPTMVYFIFPTGLTFIIYIIWVFRIEKRLKMKQ